MSHICYLQRPKCPLKLWQPLSYDRLGTHISCSSLGVSQLVVCPAVLIKVNQLTQFTFLILLGAISCLEQAVLGKGTNEHGQSLKSSDKWSWPGTLPRFPICLLLCRLSGGPLPYQPQAKLFLTTKMWQHHICRPDSVISLGDIQIAIKVTCMQTHDWMVRPEQSQGSPIKGGGHWWLTA